jgi:sulfate transport system ATP-binding protein
VQRIKNGTAPAFEAKVNYIHAIGPLVRLELQQLGQDAVIEAELTQERFRELGLSTGEQVFIYPRNVRVFVDNTASA